MAIKIMIADDHSMIREGLKSLLELEGDIQVVAEAEDGVKSGRVGSMQESLDRLRESLVNRKNENV